jgi:hypothetical protein
MESYDKYSGKTNFFPIMSNIKRCHNLIKRTMISKFDENIDLLIDIGSGRGSDIFTWNISNIKRVIGIEPSSDSIKQSIFKYKKISSKSNMKIQYLNGIGNKKWDDGSASLNEKDTSRFIELFGKRKIKADRINLFWTIHYMLDSVNDFKYLFNNIDTHLKIGGKVVMMYMSGSKISKLLERNNGEYVITKNDDVIFKLTQEYDNIDDIFGNKIKVFFKGTYGLEKGIVENLVFGNFIRKHFKKNNYELVYKKKYTDLDLDCIKEQTEDEKKISSLYYIMVFEKK